MAPDDPTEARELRELLQARYGQVRTAKGPREGQEWYAVEDAATTGPYRAELEAAYAARQQGCAERHRQPDPVSAEWTLDVNNPEAVREVMARNEGRIRTCQEDALLAEGCLVGTVRIHAIASHYTLQEVTVVGDSTETRRLAECVVGAARGIRLHPGTMGTVALAWRFDSLGE